jgi:acetyl esterase/lipase
LAQDKNASQTTYVTQSNVLYYDNEQDLDDYQKERCRLDLYYPEEKKDFVTVVWFHGGGLKGGNKYIPNELKEKGIAIAAVNYRLYPNIKCPVYLKDAAAAVAWIFDNIEKYGGDPNKIVISGHSAGGYLTSMIGLDKKWLAPHDIDADKIWLLVPFSGHTITHMTVREERGIPAEQAIVDEFAPLYHVRNDAPPMVLITGGRDLELLGRYEENTYFWRMMQVAGHLHTSIYEVQGFDHGGMPAPAFSIMLDHINAMLNE